ncbi:hypothetical protein ACW5XF_02215 [Aeromonas lusitana]|uniref:hypothetical protein n=1 Tax=Aeromonas lusitana TaxID=931529 RepID=UPI0012FE30D1|nr:hypothetical protein [Aeromonas lusitana]
MERQKFIKLMKSRGHWRDDEQLTGEPISYANLNDAGSSELIRQCQGVWVNGPPGGDDNLTTNEDTAHSNQNKRKFSELLDNSTFPTQQQSDIPDYFTDKISSENHTTMNTNSEPFIFTPDFFQHEDFNLNDFFAQNHQETPAISSPDLFQQLGFDLNDYFAQKSQETPVVSSPDFFQQLGFDLNDFFAQHSQPEPYNLSQSSGDEYQLPIFEKIEHDNLLLSLRAYKAVRDRFSDLGKKSGNKVKKSDATDILRQNDTATLVCETQKNIYFSASSNGFYDFTTSMEKGVGNCGEMSGAAAQIVNKSGGYATQYCVDNKGSHAFALSGKPPLGATDHIKMSDYNGCWVIDPWAGIFCEAPYYCQQFEAKMKKWASKNKQILTWNEQIPSQAVWIPADTQSWINAVVNGIKTISISNERFSL